MLKRLVSLALVSLFIFSFNSSYAQISDEDYSTQMKALKDELGQTKEEYTQAKKASRKATMENFFSFGKTKEEKEARKEVLKEAKQKEAKLREAYKEAKENIRSQERKLKASRKEAKKTVGKTKKETEKAPGNQEKDLKKGLGKGKGKK